MASLVNTIKRTLKVSIRTVTTTVDVALDATNTGLDAVEWTANQIKTQGIKQIGANIVTGTGYTVDLLTDSDIGTLEARIEALQAKSQKELFTDIQSLLREDT